MCLDSLARGSFALDSFLSRELERMRIHAEWIVGGHGFPGGHIMHMQSTRISSMTSYSIDKSGIMTGLEIALRYFSGGMPYYNHVNKMKSYNCNQFSISSGRSKFPEVCFDNSGKWQRS